MTLKQKSNVKGVRGHQKVFVDRDQAKAIVAELLYKPRRAYSLDKGEGKDLNEKSDSRGWKSAF